MKKIIQIAIVSSLITVLNIGCSKSSETPPTPPVANFSFSGAGVAPSTVIFTNNSTNATSYVWEFGDNSTSTEANPSHTYTTGGTFSVKLTAVGLGGSNYTTKSVSITKPTSLQIIVADLLGTPIPGATVKLYSSLTDFLNTTNQVLTTQTTNANGVATFSPLSPIKYYWSAVSGCQNNYFYPSTYSTTNVLTPNTINTEASILFQTGKLSIKNNSVDPYYIYLNGSILTRIEAGTTYTLEQQVGPKTVKLEQISGYVFSATIKQYQISVTCGNTTTITFP